MINEIGRLERIIAYSLGTHIYDDFNDNAINANIWGTAVTGGASTLAETGGELKITNVAAAGYAYIPTVKTFGKSLEIKADIDIVDGEVAGDGERCEAYIELYVDANNYFQFGLYRDETEAINSRGYVTYRIGGGAEVTDDVDGTDLDNVSREYKIIVDEHHVHVYLDRQLLGTYAFEGLTEYVVRLVAGTENLNDAIDIRFDNFEIIPYWEKLREIYAKLDAIQGGSNSIETIQTTVDAILDLAREGASGTLTPTDTSENTLIELLAQTNPFEFGGGSIKLDNMENGDTVIIRIYKKIAVGDTYANPFDTLTKPNVQSHSIEIGGFHNQYGFKVTLAQTTTGAAGYKAFKHEWFTSMV